MLKSLIARLIGIGTMSVLVGLLSYTISKPVKYESPETIEYGKIVDEIVKERKPLSRDELDELKRKEKIVIEQIASKTQFDRDVRDFLFNKLFISIFAFLYWTIGRKFGFDNLVNQLAGSIFILFAPLTFISVVESAVYSCCFFLGGYLKIRERRE